jgi:hypothetical protein
MLGALCDAVPAMASSLEPPGARSSASASWTDHRAPAATETGAGACRPRQRPPFCAKVGLGKAREELGAIAGIAEWARAGCWLRASLG